MNLANTIQTGFREIWAHRFRSLLTMLGIILGVSSLVAMSALVKGLEHGLREALVAIGGLEQIRVEAEDDLPDYQRHLEDQAVGITLKDVQALENSAPLLSEITPAIENYLWRSGTVVSHGRKTTRPYMFSGTWPSALSLNEHIVEHGRMFNEIDDLHARKVCVIGTGVRDELFGDPDVIDKEIIPVGETVSINEMPFTIIGMFQHYESEQYRKKRELMKHKPKVEQSGPRRRRGWSSSRKGGHFIFRLKNNTIYIPLNTMVAYFNPTGGTNATSNPRLSTLNMKIPNVDLLEPALQQARNVLMQTHKGIEDFTFRTQEDWADEITTAIRNARMSGGIIAIISLIVGGIGIMNILFASISERLREIGIRKAVGAYTFDIFVQILVESMVISVLGGLLGLATSWGLVQLIASFTPEANTPIITWGAMLLGFSCSAMVGVLAGLLPAIKASRLHPIQALRYD